MGQADQKIIPHRYQVVPRTLCFITHGDDILLLRGAPDKRIWPNQYNGVGGHVEPGEDVRTAAQREVREETGLDARDLRLRGMINIPVEGNTGILLFVFTAEGTPEWIARDRLAGLALVEDLPTLLPRLLAMRPDDPPFFAHYRYDEQDRLTITFSERSVSEFGLKALAGFDPVLPRLPG